MDNIFSPNRKAALITGSSSGIGLHIAHVYADAGATVILAARRIDRVKVAVAELCSKGYKAYGAYLDVMKTETIRAGFESAEDQCGAPIDILYNNSGIIYSKPFVEQEEAEITRGFDTNLKGAMLVAQEAARRMLNNGGGIIINIASIVGMLAGGSVASYAASKAGLLHLTNVMAFELVGKGIGSTQSAQEISKPICSSRSRNSRKIYLNGHRCVVLDSRKTSMVCRCYWLRTLGATLRVHRYLWTVDRH